MRLLLVFRFINFVVINLHHNGVVCRNIYISPTRGIQSTNCGTAQNPCSDVNDVIEKLSTNDDVTLILENSNNPVTNYDLRIPINISNKRLTITKNSSTHQNPVIVGKRDTISTNYVFQPTTNDSWSLRVESIDFLNTNLLLHHTGNGTVSLKNCKSRYSVQPSSLFSSFIRSSSQTLKQQIFTVDITVADSSFELYGFLILQENKELYIGDIDIRDSQIIGGKIFISHTLNTARHKSSFRMENVQMSQCRGPVLHLQSVSEAVFRNVSMTNNTKQSDERVGLYIAGTASLPTNIVLDNVEMTENREMSYLLSCSHCTLLGGEMSLVGNTNCSGVLLQQCNGRMALLKTERNIIARQLFYSSQSRLTIDKILAEKNEIFYNEGIQLNQDTRMQVKTLQITDSNMKHRPLLVINSHLVVDEIVTLRNNTIKVEAVRLHASTAILQSIVLSNNTVHQGILVTGNSTVHIAKGLLVQNRVVSSFIGVVESKNLSLEKFHFDRNVVAGSMLHIISSNSVSMRHFNFTRNTFPTCLNIQKSNTFIQQVFAADNIATGYGKVLYYRDEGSKFNVTLLDFYVSVPGHNSYQSKDYVFDISIQNTNLLTRNISILTTKMMITSVSVLKLQFATTNKNVAPNIRMYCPQNFNPNNKTHLTESSITYEVGCTSCPRGLYSALGGSDDMIRINNKTIDVRTWKRDSLGAPLIEGSGATILTCKQCPAGGDCSAGIKSRGNHFGYISSPDTISFLPCPNQYCCSSQHSACVNYTSCDKNREGTLCGSCIHGYYDSYFSPRCISAKKCTVSKQITFWTVFVVTASSLVLVICFTTDILTIISHLYSRLKSRIDGMRYRTGSTIDPVVLSPAALALVLPNDEVTQERLSSPDKKVLFVYEDNILVGMNLDAEGDEKISKNFNLAALIQIFISFYQILYLITIQSDLSTDNAFGTISKLFNLETFVYAADDVCPYTTIGAVSKRFIKNVVFILLMLFIVTSAVILTELSTFMSFRRSSMKHIVNNNRIRNKQSTTLKGKVAKLSLYHKLVIAYAKTAMFGYKNISQFCLAMIHCVPINGVDVLYISGNTKCHSQWYYTNWVLLFLWVIPFPIALTLAYEMLKKEKIQPFMFMLCLTFPILTPATYFYLRINTNNAALKDEEYHEMRLSFYQLFEEPYKDDNLDDKHRIVWWGTWRLYERLLIAATTTFIVHPILRMCIVGPMILTMLLLHYYLKPFKKGMKLLTCLDISSLACLCFHVMDNMFRAFMYTFDIPLQYPVDTALQILNHLQIVFTPITILIGYFLWRGVRLVGFKTRFSYLFKKWE